MHSGEEVCNRTWYDDDGVAVATINRAANFYDRSYHAFLAKACESVVAKARMTIVTACWLKWVWGFTMRSTTNLSSLAHTWAFEHVVWYCKKYLSKRTRLVEKAFLYSFASEALWPGRCRICTACQQQCSWMMLSSAHVMTITSSSFEWPNHCHFLLTLQVNSYYASVFSICNYCYVIHRVLNRRSYTISSI